MEFIAEREGSIIPNPENPTSNELASTQAAIEFFRENAAYIRHCQQRLTELGRSGQDTVITVINVDDPVGSALADILMPGHDWQQYRDAGELPVARGLARKHSILEFLLNTTCTTTTSALEETDDLRVLVISEGGSPSARGRPYCRSRPTTIKSRNKSTRNHVNNLRKMSSETFFDVYVCYPYASPNGTTNRTSSPLSSLPISLSIQP